MSDELTAAKAALWQQMRRFVTPDDAPQMLAAYAEAHPDRPDVLEGWVPEDYQATAKHIQKEGVEALEAAATLLIERDAKRKDRETVQKAEAAKRDTPQRRAMLMTKIEEECGKYGIGLRLARDTARGLGIENELRHMTADERQQVLNAIRGQAEKQAGAP